MSEARRRVTRLLAAAVVLAVAAPGARAQTPALAELERQALAQSPVLAAARADLAARRAAARAAGAFDDPLLEVDARSLLPTGDHEPAEAMVVLSQPLPGRGQRAAARALAAAEVALGEAEVGRAEQILLRDVRLAWAELYAITRELDAMTDAHEVLDLLVTTSANLFGAGQSGLVAPLVAQLEQSRHDIELEAADARLRTASARLAALIGAAGEQGFPRVTTLPDVVLPRIDPATAAPFALEAVVAERRVALAERRAEAIEAGLAPGFMVGGGLLLMDGRDPNLVARFGVEIPVFRARRERPRLEAAGLELEAERERRRAAELDARAALARWLADGRRLETVRRRYQEAVLPQATAALDAARTELLNGRAPLSDTLERFEEWYEDRIAAARAEAELYAAWAEIEALLASPLPAAPAGGSR